MNQLRSRVMQPPHCSAERHGGTHAQRAARLRHDDAPPRRLLHGAGAATAPSPIRAAGAYRRGTRAQLEADAAFRPDRREPALGLSRRSGGVVAQAPSTAAARPDEAMIEASSLLVLGLCCLIGSVRGLDRVTISIAILPMSAEYGYTDSTKGLVAAAFSVGYRVPCGACFALGEFTEKLNGD